MQGRPGADTPAGHDAAAGDMVAEFEVLPAWTAQALASLGQPYAVPGACRGSGTPAALEWLLAGLRPAPGELLLDVGAGMGGPAAFARLSTGARPVLVDPSPAASRASRELFDTAATCATGQRLPFADASFRVAWCLGTICTTDAQADLVGELGRVVRSEGRVGLLTVVAADGAEFEPPEGNHFPTLATLHDLLDAAGLEVVAERRSDSFPDAPRTWQAAEQAVVRLVEERHHHDPRFRATRRQEDTLGRLRSAGHILGMLTLATRVGAPSPAHCAAGTSSQPAQGASSPIFS